jgi:hypothetical protein
MEVATDQQLEDMQRMVTTGQMAFLNGAFSMHDEASPSYVDMVDNTALGHRLIAQTVRAGRPAPLRPALPCPAVT